MATITFPAAASGATFFANTFDALAGGTAWTPADSLIAAGQQNEAAGNHGGSILILPATGPLDLSTLGATEGVITAAVATFSHQGTYATVGPGTLYNYLLCGGTSFTEANGASWSDPGATADLTGFFAGSNIEDLPTYDWALFQPISGGGSIENGVHFGYQITAFEIEFTYTPAGAVVTDVSPTHGDVAGNTVVTLTGTGFTGKTVASFGGTPTTFTPASDVSGTCVTPAHAFGQVTVTVS